MSLTQNDLERIQSVVRGEVRTIVRDELKPIIQRLDRVEQRLDRVGDAVVHLANCWPGTMPGRKSHMAREVEKIITPT